jgi:Bifunctional DNA primase/polymerase, N-terminal
MTLAPAEIRLGLLACGFSPLPLRGKVPTPKGWQVKFQTNKDEIALWQTMWPNADNTRILTRFAPALDIDITVPDAADAVEELASGHFGEHGDILVRFGKAPKRAILLILNRQRSDQRGAPIREC